MRTRARIERLSAALIPRPGPLATILYPEDGFPFGPPAPVIERITATGWTIVHRRVGDSREPVSVESVGDWRMTETDFAV
ncbi:MAG: hypothetical protein HZB26_07280 [Candidatus Hydrogenedentes bacterium]|nr:hypothetical protein [Candidatus Hydrogenedentota bacterium]